MHQDLVHLGQVFRQRREEKKLSLKEIENALSIRVHFLSAIEEGQLVKLISPIYIQGFIRKYAAFLDLDADVLFQEHPYITNLLNNPVSPAEESYRDQDKSDENKGSGLIWVGISVVCLLCLWLLATYAGLF